MRPRRLLGFVALLVLLLVLAFAVAKESREPYLWLFIDDLIRPKPAPMVLPLFDDLAVRLYSDTRPHVGKVARLQKGLVLEEVGGAIVEEGFGFGLPIVEVGGQAYLPQSAATARIGDTLVKRYHMDILDTPSGFLRRKYEPVPPQGTVTISYTMQAGDIHIAVDFTELTPDWDRAYLMNEQGARRFTRYEEPGLVVEGEALGIWQATSATTGCVVAEDRTVQFCVETEEAMSRYYGRERYKQYYWIGVYQLSWAGIDLELSPPVERFEYLVRVERPNHD